jgi:hypothetical protein
MTEVGSNVFERFSGCSIEHMREDFAKNIRVKCTSGGTPNDFTDDWPGYGKIAGIVVRV